MIVVVCGVSGAGKSTVGALLAEAMDLPFFDGDDFHPIANKEKMASGQSLTDEDRRPWLETLSGAIATWSNQKGAVLACSALKEAHRAKLSETSDCDVHWIILHGSEDLIRTRLQERKGHFFDPSLLKSQFEDFEVPAYGLQYNVQRSSMDIVKAILIELSNGSTIA